MPDGPPAPPPAAADRPPLAPWLAGLLIVGLGAAVWLAAAAHEANLLPSRGWRLLAIFLPTILALMLRPLPGGAAVLLAVLTLVMSVLVLRLFRDNDA